MPFIFLIILWGVTLTEGVDSPFLSQGGEPEFKYDIDFVFVDSKNEIIKNPLYVEVEYENFKELEGLNILDTIIVKGGRLHLSTKPVSQLYIRVLKTLNNEAFALSFPTKDLEYSFSKIEMPNDNGTYLVKLNYISVNSARSLSGRLSYKKEFVDTTSINLTTEQNDSLALFISKNDDGYYIFNAGENMLLCKNPNGDWFNWGEIPSTRSSKWKSLQKISFDSINDVLLLSLFSIKDNRYGKFIAFVEKKVSGSILHCAWLISNVKNSKELSTLTRFGRRFNYSKRFSYQYKKSLGLGDFIYTPDVENILSSKNTHLPKYVELRRDFNINDTSHIREATEIYKQNLMKGVRHIWFYKENEKNQRFFIPIYYEPYKGPLPFKK